MVKTRSQSRLQVDTINIYTEAEKLRVQNATAFQKSGIIWQDDDTIIEQIKAEIEAGVKHEDEKTRKNIDQHEFIEKNRVSRDLLEHNREVDKMYDNDFLSKQLENQRDGNKPVMSVIVNGLKSNIPFRRAESICLGPPLTDIGVPLKNFDLKPPLTANDTVREIMFGEILPLVEWTVDDICPGWNKHVYKIFYDFQPGDKTMGDYTYDERAICRPCTTVDGFWFASEPSKYKGLVVCLPNPLEFMQYKWEYDKVGLIGMFVIVMIFSYGMYRLIVPKTIRDIVESVPDIIQNGKTRGRKPKEKEE